MFDYQDILKKAVPHLLEHQDRYITGAMGFLSGVLVVGGKGKFRDRKTHLNITDQDIYKLLKGGVINLDGAAGGFVVMSKDHLAHLVKAAKEGLKQ